MVGRLFIFVLAIAGLIWFLHWLRKAPTAQVSRRLRQGALWGAIGLLVALALTGRLNPLFAALAAAIPIAMRGIHLLLMLPAIRQAMRSLGIGGLAGGAAQAGSSGTAGQNSSIRTRFLEMTLDHASGDMDGLVLEGEYQGQRLSELEQDALLRLLDRCRREDGQSAALLEAYLDRTQGEDWRQAAPGGPGVAHQASGPMNREEARAVLGLAPGADDTAIRDAHRRLMQRLHPDRGGSDYLAAKINEAKRVLLGD